MTEILQYANQAEIATRPSYLAGYDAHGTYGLRAINPYPLFSEDWACWHLGWVDAREESEEQG